MSTGGRHSLTRWLSGNEAAHTCPSPHGLCLSPDGSRNRANNKKSPFPLSF